MTCSNQKLKATLLPQGDVACRVEEAILLMPKLREANLVRKVRLLGR